MGLVAWYLAVLVLFIKSIQGKPYTYSLDDDRICQNAVVSQWLNNDDTVVVMAKASANADVNEYSKCHLKLGPHMNAQKQYTQIRFETFAIGSCDVKLYADESPYALFDSEVTNLFTLTCGQSPGHSTFVSQKGNNVRITLEKDDHKQLNYNFRFNVTLTDVPEETGLSVGILVGIVVVCVVTIIGVGCIVLKYMQVRQWGKRALSRQTGHSQRTEIQTVSPQHHHHITRNEPAVRYTSLPRTDETGGSQVIIVGTENTSGVCSLCHRNHEDFAHVIDIDVNGHDHPGHHHPHHHHPLHTNHPHQHPNPQHRHSPSSRRSSRYTETPRGSNSNVRGSHPNVTSTEDDLDEFPQNDLIPPSYDLAPPSYEEAVDMPTPNSGRPDASRSAEDPLYQNISDLGSGS